MNPGTSQTAEQGLAFTVLLGCLVDMSSDDAQWGWKARQVEATLRSGLDQEFSTPKPLNLNPKPLNP